LASGQSYVSNTTEDGTFAFEDIRPGTYRVVAEKAGYARGSSGQDVGAGLVIEVTPGLEVTGLRVSMTEAGVISGRVVSNSGDPIQILSVRLLKNGFSSEGDPVRVEVATSQVDDRGLFRLAGIPEGEYYIAVRPPSSYMLPGYNLPGSEMLRGVYFGDTASLQEARKIKLREGEKLQNLEIHLPVSQLSKVEGRIVGSQSIADLQLTTSVMDVSLWDSSAKSTEDGSFHFMAPPGRYVLRAGTNDFTGMIEIDVPPNGVTGVVLPMAATTSLAGRVVVNEGVNLGSLRFVLRPRPPGANRTSGVIGSEKALSFARLGPVQYYLVPENLPNGLYIAEGRLGDRDVLKEGFDANSIRSSDVLVITLRQTACEIIGQVLGGSENLPMAGLPVTVVPDPPQPQRHYLYQRTITDQNGNFDFRNLAPGNYRLHAWQDLPTNAELNLDFMQPYWDHGTLIEVTNDRTQTLVLRPTGR